MNIVNETANKVRELEKRLDMFEGSGGLGVTEIKKEFEDVFVDLELYVFLASYSVSVSGSLAVFQGQINFGLAEGYESARVRTILKCDGYIIHSEIIEINAGKLMHQIIHTIPSGVGDEKDLELVLVPESGAFYLKGYDAFIWGYGVAVKDGYSPVSNITAASYGENYAFILVNDRMAYLYEGALPTSENFSAVDFSYLTRANQMACVYLPKEQDGVIVPTLYAFKVSPGEVLTYLTGEGLTNESEAIATKVGSVSACFDKVNNQIIVAYSCLKELYYFTFNGETISPSVLLYTFDEWISEVCLIENCEDVFYLAVGLTSGKNYMFSTVNNIGTVSLDEGRVTFRAAASFG